jgi:hypothetical protein
VRLNESPAQLYYINQVLGAGTFVSQREVSKEPRLRFMVYVEKELQGDEREFIRKMFAAISENDFLWQIATLDEETLEKHQIRFGVCFSKPVASKRTIRWSELPSLDTLLGRQVATEQMNAAKKTAWAQLKALRLEMDQL